MDVRIKYTHPQFAVLDVKNSQIMWNMVIVYGSPDHHLRNRLWSDLNHEQLDLCKEWMVAGDFNSVTSCEEVNNLNTFNQRRCRGMKDWVFREGLIDVGFSGPKFTWRRGGKNEKVTGQQDWTEHCVLRIFWIVGQI